MCLTAFLNEWIVIFILAYIWNKWYEMASVAGSKILIGRIKKKEHFWYFSLFLWIFYISIWSKWFIRFNCNRGRNSYANILLRNFFYSYLYWKAEKILQFEVRFGRLKFSITGSMSYITNVVEIHGEISSQMLCNFALFSCRKDIFYNNRNIS